jgi:ATP phosphoribosyltransferase regulatory subunit HisZ
LDKLNALSVFIDNGGTCSTKHALLKRFAEENNRVEIKLMLGIFNMNSNNTPKISDVLKHYNLQEIPKALNYLKFKNEILDYTSKNSKPEDFINDLIEEIEIQTNQITDFKVEFHKNFLITYLKQHSDIFFDIEEFWEIREECISTLQK